MIVANVTNQLETTLALARVRGTYNSKIYGLGATLRYIKLNLTLTMVENIILSHLR